MTRARADALVAALVARFGGEAEAEQVNQNGRYRFAIVSPQFNSMPHLRRQDEAWKVVDEVLSREETLDVSLILTYAPGDLAQAAEGVA
jgi:hypothetical protein